jgi:hypothetical protein
MTPCDAADGWRELITGTTPGAGSAAALRAFADRVRSRPLAAAPKGPEVLRGPNEPADCPEPDPPADPPPAE